MLSINKNGIIKEMLGIGIMKKCFEILKEFKDGRRIGFILFHSKQKNGVDAG